MKKIRVIIQHKSNGTPAYVCYLTENGWKCGKCQRGLLGNGELGTECKVCHAVVRQSIDDDPNYHVVERKCAMCGDKLVDGETLALHYKYGGCSFNQP